MNKYKSSKPFPLVSLHYLGGQSKIWLNPKYQREAVWTKSQKQLLIDSVLRDIDIPKIYFREITDDAGHEFEVVDGQQRLRAVFDFMNNNFRMPSDSDDVDGFPLASKTFDELDTNLQMKLQNATFDVVTYNTAYSDTDIEETFLRMQNGTPLNAPEKRRAISGNMRIVVEELAKHNVFELCSFNNTRFAYEDAVAKILHQLLHGSITDLRPTSIVRTYSYHKTITTEQKEVRRLTSSFNFLKRAFANTATPGLKKYSIVTLTFLVAEMLDVYDLSKHPEEFAVAYLDFDSRRIANEELPEEEQDTILAAYTDAARSDSLQDMTYRHETLKKVLVDGIPELVLRDPNRFFTEEQRMAIYRRDKGKCQFEGCGVFCDESDFHADHIVPHSRGGLTSVSNGRVLCPPHNRQLGDRN